MPRILGFLFFALVAATVALARPLDTAPWLVDLGRDYPRTPQAGLSDADAEITLLLMQAASRIDPKLPDAWLWQFDMLTALNRPEAAREALARYVQAQPGDIAAHLQWIGLEADRLQTAEQRAEFFATQLRQPNLPSKVASDLHRRLAEFHRNRDERDKALAQAKAAVASYDLNFTARDLLDDLQAAGRASGEDRVAELQSLLLVLSASPGNPDRVLDTADGLMQLNLPEPAERLYAHAVALLKMSDPQGHLPGALTDDAVALRMLGRDVAADAAVKQASEGWKKLLARAGDAFGPELTAEMAWFYCRYEPLPKEAERLAQLALAERPELVVARRALGSALRQQGQLDAAKLELEQVADRDAAAAVEYARVLAAQQQADLARQTLGRAATQPADASARMMQAEALRELGAAPPASQAAPVEGAAAVAAFNWAVLDYPLHPDKYLTLTLSMPRRDMPPGEPWILKAQLKNIGPFPIAFGEGLMVAPDLLISVDTTGDKQRTSGPTIRSSFNRTIQLLPGEAVETAETVELGTIRSGMIGTPQQTHEVTVTAVLSPVQLVNAQGQQVWAADIGGLIAEVKFQRMGLQLQEGTVASLIRQTRAADPADRIAAIELLTMLLAEHQYIQSGWLSYTVRAIDPVAVQAAILAAASDADARVRARLAECLRWFALDKDATQAALQSLSDPDWLVRGLTFRAMADHHGLKVLDMLTKTSTADPDDWVRAMARMLRARIAPASQPASQSGSESSPAK